MGSSEEEDNDLTRLEDLGEFQHEEDSGPGEDIPDIPGVAAFSEDLPETPLEEEPLTEDEAFAESLAEDETFAEPLTEDETFSEPLSEDEALAEPLTEDEAFAESLAEDAAPEEAAETEDAPEEETTPQEIVPETPEPPPPPPPPAKKEDFQDVKQFAEAISPNPQNTEANPAFSVAVRNIRTEREAEQILAILRDYGICTEDNLKNYQQGLGQGAVLVPHIGEYLAIHLVHKFRRFNVEVDMGPAAQVHASSSYAQEGDRGLVNSESLTQNVRRDVSLRPPEPSGPLTSTLPCPAGFAIKKHLQPLTSHALIPDREWRRLHDEEGAPDLAEIYEGLVDKLKERAEELAADGVVGVSFAVTPIPPARPSDYKITCSGNAVRLKPVE